MARQPSDAEEFPLPQFPAGAVDAEFQSQIEAFNRQLSEWYEKINGYISYGSAEAMAQKGRMWSGHFNGEFIDVIVPDNITDFPVQHNLGRIPLGFFQMDIGTDPTTGGVLRRRAETPAHTATQLWVWTTSQAGAMFRILVF